MIFRESSAEEFIDALRPEDIEFAKKLMKDLLHKSLNEEKTFFDENGEATTHKGFFDSEEYFKESINYYFNKKNEAKKLVKRKRK